MSGPERDPLADVWLTTSDLADLFHVSGKTIGRWARDKRIPVDSRTLGGGHRRWRARPVLNLLAELDPTEAMSDADFAIWLARRRPRRRGGC
jgi:Helix-turn-helix domain